MNPMMIPMMGGMMNPYMSQPMNYGMQGYQDPNMGQGYYDPNQ